MNKPNLVRHAGPVAVAILVAAGAVAVTASAVGFRFAPVAAAPAAKASPNTAKDPCAAYVGHLAKGLNVSPDRLSAAALQAAKDTVKEEVANGTLTGTQGDRLLSRLGTGGASVCAGFGDPGATAQPGPTGVKPHGGEMKGAGAAYLAAAASVLGITPDSLKQDLKAGQSISQLAAGKVSEADFRLRVIAALKPQLDAAVAAGTITQAQEDAQLARLAKGDPPLWAAHPLPTPTP